MNFFANKIKDNLFALESIVRSVLLTHGQFEETASKYRFKCQICKDSKWSRKKKRGYILKDKDVWVYYCHNCGYKKKVTEWLREKHPAEYQVYQRNLYRPKNDDDEYAEFIYNQTREANIIKEKTENYKSEVEARQFFIPITDPNAKPAYQYLVDRQIPFEKWSHWLFATDGLYKNRIVIPYLNEQGRVYYYQCRTIVGDEPKYLFSKHIPTGMYPIFGYYQADKTKLIPILEGQIDSLFVENSVAVGGIKIGIDGIENCRDRVYMLDLDDSGMEMTMYLLERNERVFDWAKFVHDYNIPRRSKWDVNEIVIHIGGSFVFTTEIINRYVIRGKFNKPMMEIFWNGFKI